MMKCCENLWISSYTWGILEIADQWSRSDSVDQWVKTLIFQNQKMESILPCDVPSEYLTPLADDQQRKVIVFLLYNDKAF